VISAHVRHLREMLGHDLLLLPSTSVLPRDDDGRILLVRLIDTGNWLRSRGEALSSLIDGRATPDEFWTFARTSQIPWGLRKAYLRFAMRTVVGVAPSRDQLAASFDGLGLRSLEVRRMEFLPFLVAQALIL
jgi:hypothetical protein